MAGEIEIAYCTTSDFKKQEWECVRDQLELPSLPGKKLSEIFCLDFRGVRTEEPLLCNLEEMVRFKAMSAYRAVRVPCIVEHAGIILDGYEAHSFPGGLTQPMWDALGAEHFVASCKPLTLRAKARAVVGYCDGLNIHTFVGETSGTLAEKPKGARAFYWDTVFCPEGHGDKSYAEIADEVPNGLLNKLRGSQSIKALLLFMEHRRLRQPALFSYA